MTRSRSTNRCSGGGSPAIISCMSVRSALAFLGIHVYPHDRSAFTQGVEYRGGFLYEGAGLTGRSSLRKVELQTGKVLQETRLAPQFFGEGITVVNQRVVEL